MEGTVHKLRANHVSVLRDVGGGGDARVIIPKKKR